MARIPYAARFDTPTLLEQGRDWTIDVRTARAGASAQPASGTVSLFNAAGVAVVDEETVTPSASGASILVTAAVTVDETRGTGWRVRWTLTMPDSEVHVFENDAVLCRCVPSPVVTEGTLFARVPALDPTGAARISARTDYSTSLDSAWIEITNRLLTNGSRVELVLSPSSLREVHLLLTLAMVFEDLATRLNGAYLEQARDWRQQYGAAWGRLQLRAYGETSTDGAAPAETRPGRASVWLV